MDMNYEDKDKVHNISKSALNQFLGCEKQYEYQRVHRTPPSNGVDVSALIQGITVHSLTEMLDRAEPVTQADIQEQFLDAVSSKIGRGLEVNNIVDLVRDFDIENKDPEKQYQRYSLSIEAYKELKTEYKEKINNVLEKVPLYIDLYKKQLERTLEIGKKIIDIKIENRESLKLPIAPGHVAHLTSILDRCFFMSGKDIVQVESQLPSELEVEKKLKSFTIAELQAKAANHGVQLNQKAKKQKIIDDIFSYEYGGIVENVQKEHEENQQKEAEFLKSVGYGLEDSVPVVLEIKTASKTKTLGDVKKLIDPYIYSMIFWLVYNRIPVFQVVYLIVTPNNNTKIQRFNIFITERMLELMKSRFISICKRIFIDDDFQPSFTGQNYLCNPKKCQYWDICQDGMTMVAQIL